MRSSFPMMERISASYEIGCFRYMTGRRRVHTEGFSNSLYSAVIFAYFTAENGHYLKSLCIVAVSCQMIRRCHTEGFSNSLYSAVFFVDFTAKYGHCPKSLCIVAVSCQMSRRCHTEGFFNSLYSAVIFAYFTAENGHYPKSLCIGVAVLTVLADVVQLYYTPFLSHAGTVEMYLTNAS